MNEQLTVKNFGPIKEATVDFKRVTVFIGPTGGGKSTLAKLAAVFRDAETFAFGNAKFDNREIFKQCGIDSYFTLKTVFAFERRNAFGIYVEGVLTRGLIEGAIGNDKDYEKILNDLGKIFGRLEELNPQAIPSERRAILEQQLFLLEQKEDYDREYLALLAPKEQVYIPQQRRDLGIISRYESTLKDGVLNNAASFADALREINELEIPFLNVKYLHRNGQDFIQVPGVETLFRLYETASGIQSVTPLLVLLEHLSRNIEQAQSFIIEEPELNLYPTAQQGLLNWLVEKCTKGDNDLTITTHSPYILSSCNLLLEAYKVAQQRPELADEIDKVVPRACWLNPDEFAAYHVADGTVRPITDARTHLIGGNELDAVSGDISDSFRRLLQLKKQAA